MLKSLTLKEIGAYYPELSIQDIITRWSNRYIYRLYLMGFKWCTKDDILLKVDESHCRICGTKMRSRNRSNKRRKNIYSVPINSPLIIDRKLGVVI